MAKDKRPKRIETNRAGLEEYLKSLESTVETDTLDAPGSTEKPAVSPDYFFRDKGMATGGPKAVERKSKSNTFESVVGPKQKNLESLVTEIQNRMVGYDEKDPGQKRELSELTKIFTERLKEAKREEHGIANYLGNYPMVKSDAMLRLKGEKQFIDEETVKGLTEEKLGMPLRPDQSAISESTQGVVESDIPGLMGVDYRPTYQGPEKELKPEMPRPLAIGLVDELTWRSMGKSKQRELETMLDSPSPILPFISNYTVMRSGGNVVSGALRTIEGLAGAGEFISQFDPVKAAAFKSLGNQIDQWARGFEPKDEQDFEDQVFSGLGSMLMYMVPGGLVGKGVSAAGLGAKTASTLGLSTMTALESLMEAGSVYRETKDDAAFGKSFLANLVLIGLTNKFGFGSETKSLIKKALLSSPLEGLQEGGQEIIQAIATGKPIDYDAVWTATGVGMIIGGGASVVSPNQIVAQSEQQKYTDQRGTINVGDVGLDQLTDLSPEERRRAGLEPEKFEDVIPTQTSPKAPVDAQDRGFGKSVKETMESKEIVKLRDEGVDIDETMQPGKVLIRDKTVKDDKGSVPVYSVPVEHFTPEKVVDLINRGRKQFGKETEPTETAKKDIEGVAPAEKIKPEKVEAAETTAEGEGIEDVIKAYDEIKKKINSELKELGLDDLIDEELAFEENEGKLEDLGADAAFSEALGTVTIGKEPTRESVVHELLHNKIRKNPELQTAKIKDRAKTLFKRLGEIIPDGLDKLKRMIDRYGDQSYNSLHEEIVILFLTSKGFRNDLKKISPTAYKMVEKFVSDTNAFDIEAYHSKDFDAKMFGKKPARAEKIEIGGVAFREKSTGKIYKGKKGETHGDLAIREGLENRDWDEFDSGFVDNKGNFLDRTDTRESTGKLAESTTLGVGKEQPKPEKAASKTKAPAIKTAGDLSVRQVMNNNAKEYPTPKATTDAKKILGDKFDAEYEKFKKQVKPINFAKGEEGLAKGERFEMFVRRVVAADKLGVNELFGDKFAEAYEKAVEQEASELEFQIKEKPVEKPKIDLLREKEQNKVAKVKEVVEQKQGTIYDIEIKGKSAQQVIANLEKRKQDQVKREGTLAQKDLSKEAKERGLSESEYRKLLQDNLEGNKEPIRQLENYVKSEEFKQQQISEKESASKIKFEEPKPQTKVEKPDRVQQLKQKIYDNLQYLNDKKMPGSQRTKAKNEAKLQVSELLKAGVAAQLKLSGGKWDLMIDGVKQNKRSLGLVEKAEKVELADIEHKPEVKKPFKELPMEIRDRQEIIAETFVEAEDLPSGSGEKVLKQGLADIKQNDGKETSPEAMAVRDAAEIIFNNGKRIIAIAHFPKQELQPEDIWMYVDGQIEEKAIKELNEMEEASEEERISAEAVIKEADDLEKRLDAADPGERNKAIGEIDQVAENLFGEAEKLGYKKKSIFAEQTSFAELAKAKVPDKGITGEGKGEETTPLFQQETEAKGQEKMFEKKKPTDAVAEQEDVGYGNESEEQLSSDAIEDFGEKIGGARKDTAESGYEMTGKGKEKDQTPSWMKGFRTGLKENGKYEPFLATERGLIQWRSREQYDTEEEAILAIKLFNVAQKYRVSGTGEEFEIYRRVTNKKFVTVKKGFKTRDEANKYLVTHADEFLDYKPQFPERPHIEDLQRTGKEVRKGDVTPQQFRDKFNFKGGEFGNWVPQDERQRILNMAYDGLIDLSDILGVPPEALSLGGNLSIAFGSRGQGLQGAQAHYEPDRAVFNLTRIKGAGSVAHEWFHAFDHYFGFQDRGKKLVKNEKGLVEIDKNKEREYISYGSVRSGRVRPEVAEAFKNVINTIYKQPKIIEVSVERFTRQIEQNTKHLEQSIKQLRDYITQDRSYGLRKKAATPEQLKKFNDLVEKIQKGELGEDAVIKTGQTKWGGMFSEIKTKQVFKELNDVLKEITGRGHYKYDGGNVKTIADYVTRIASDQAQYEHYVLNNKEQRDTPTKFYYDAKDLDKMRVSDYWSSKHEMAARAFESYIEDRITQSGNLSQYLVHSTENSIYKILFDLSPYPEGVERQRINESFDKLFEQIKHRASFDENFKKLYTYLQETSNYDINELAAKTGQPAKDIANSLNDLAKRKLVNKIPGGFEPTDEFKILLDDINKNPEKYEDDFGLLYSNPLPAMVKGISRMITGIDDIYKRYVGDKVYKALGSIVSKITPEKVKQLIVTNYGLPTEYIAARREAFDALTRYKELSKEIGDNLLIKNPITGEKFTEAEQKRLSQVIKGSVTMNPLIRDRAEKAINEIKQLEVLGKELEVLPVETYNTKLPRKRINDLLKAKVELEKKRAKIIRSLKFEKDLVLSPELADELNATQKKALAKATKNINLKIEDIHTKIRNSYVHGGEGYLKRVYLSKEQAKTLAKYGYFKPTRLDLTSAMHRKDIPYEVRKKMGEILTAAYPAAKGIMLEGKDVSFGRFFEVISENPDWASETEVQGWTKLPSDPKLGKLSEMYVEPKIAADINDVMRFTSTEEIDKFLKKINSTWKASKTIMNPATHLRNIYSNTIMLDFSGVPHTDQLRILPEAIKAIKGTGKYAAQFKASRLNNTTFTTQELGQYLDLATEDRGFMDLSIPDKLVKIYGKATLVDTQLGQFLGKVYQMEEVLGKAVKFISEVEKGKSIIEARQEANKWLFDYGEIPSIVRKLRTNPIFGVPFITWSYKAFPRIIETAITRPLTFWKYPVIFSALLKYSLQALGLDDDDWEKIKADLPERMIKGEWLLLPFRDAKGKMQMLDLTYILPYKDVYDVVESGFTLATSGRLNTTDDIVDGILGLVQAPILKSAAELMTNRDTYTNQMIWFDIDSPAEKIQKAFDHTYKTFMPSLAPEIPFLSQGGYAYHKLRSVLSDRDDYYGRTFSLAPAVTSSVFGLKTSPIEPEKNIERKEAKLENQLIQLATKENQILRDGSLSEEQRLAKAMDLERDKDDIRKQLAAMEIPVKNEEIAVTEKQIRSLQAKYSKVNLDNTKLREQYATEINKLKIKLNSLLSDPNAYTGEMKKKEESKERQKQFKKSTNLQFQKEF